MNSAVAQDDDNVKPRGNRLAACPQQLAELPTQAIALHGVPHALGGYEAE